MENQAMQYQDILVHIDDGEATPGRCWWRRTGSTSCV